MQISFEIDDIFFEENQKDSIKRTLRIQDQEIQAALGKIAKAALSEYLTMFTEGGMSNRADEAKQDRLLYLIQNYFGDNLPADSQISTIFQITQSQSKTLLKNTICRHRNKLEEKIKNSMISCMNTSMIAGEKYLVIINSEVIKEELNMLIVQNEPTYCPIAKRKGSASQFEISEDSHTLLREKLGLPQLVTN